MFGRKKATAHWIQKTHLLRRDEYICSACGRAAKKAYRNCPSCGADMRGKKYDPSWVDEAEILDILEE